MEEIGSRRHQVSTARPGLSEERRDKYLEQPVALEIVEIGRQRRVGPEPVFQIGQSGACRESWRKRRRNHRGHCTIGEVKAEAIHFDLKPEGGGMPVVTFERNNDGTVISQRPHSGVGDRGEPPNAYARSKTMKVEVDPIDIGPPCGP
ncbi:hypothetical protein D3C72_930850 [compost metagenome]